MKSIKQQWFSISILICMLLAYLFSTSGFTLNDSIAKYLKNSFIIAIFLLSGLTVQTMKLIHSIKKWQTHLFIQSVSFVLFPLIIIICAYIMNLGSGFNPVYIGFVVLACIPTTISSCVVFTNNAGGNRECALFNATLGNLLGIVLTPLLIFLLLKENVELDVTQAIIKLILLVLLPFLVGQVLHNLFAVSINSVLSKLAGSWCMLGIMLIAFINAFQNGLDLGLTDIIIILVLCLVLHIFILGFVWYTSNKLKHLFSLADRKCLTITASQKTLALGLPIIAILFAENPNLALISLPVIAYHTIQLFIDGIVVETMAKMD